MRTRNAVAVGVVLGVIFVSMLVYFTTSLTVLQAPDDFSPTNTAWNGMSTFVSMTNPSIIQNLSALPKVGEGFTLMEIGPSAVFTATQANDVSSFVSTGGTLVLADDFGSGNSLLQGMGLSSRLNGSLLVDPLFNFQNSWLILIPTVSLPGASGLGFNYGTTLVVSDPEAQVLGSSSDFSYLSPPPGGSPSSAPQGPFPVLARVPLGHGDVILVSDASVFINAMIGRGANAALLKDVINGTVLLDTSHLSVGPASKVRNLELAVYSFFSVPEVRYSAVLLGLAGIVAYRFGKDVPEEEDELKQVIQEHPEWDLAKLKKLKEEVERNE